MRIDIDKIEKFLTDNARVQAHVVLATATARPLLEAIAAKKPLIRSADEVVSEGPIRLGMALDASGRFRPGTDIETETVSLALPEGMDPERWIDERWEPIAKRMSYGVDGVSGTRVAESGGEPFVDFIESAIFDARLFAGLDGMPLKTARGFIDAMRTLLPNGAIDACFPPHLRQRHPGPSHFLVGAVEWTLMSLFANALLEDAAQLDRAARFVRVFEKTVPLGYDVRDRWLLPVL